MLALPRKGLGSIYLRRTFKAQCAPSKIVRFDSEVRGFPAPQTVIAHSWMKQEVVPAQVACSSSREQD
jgi:hypothetical protein